MTSDYTQQSTMQYGYFQQYRVMMYIRDILRNWFSDKTNIKDQRIVSMLYDSQGNLKKQAIKLGTPFTYDHKYAGATPSVNVMVGDVKYQQKGVTKSGTPGFSDNPMLPPITQVRVKQMPMIVTVTTQSYDGTLLLAQLLQLFLQMNSNNIQRDCAMLSFFQVQGVSAPQPIQSQGSIQSSAKQLYTCGIQLVTAGYLIWTQNTQGPVYNGLTIKTNFNHKD